MSIIETLRGETAKAEQSLDDQASEIRNAWRSYVSGTFQGAVQESWVREVYADYVIVCAGDEHVKVPYADGANGVDFKVEQAVPVEMTWQEVSKTVVIEKADADRQIAFGWAYVFEKEGEPVTDHSGEFVDDERVLEDAAYAFNLDFREGDERHTETVKAHLVESLVMTKDKAEAMGLDPETTKLGWWTGFYVDDAELFGKIKDGTYPMLSIGGWAERELLDA